MNVLGMILPALLPAFADGLKGLFQRIFGGTKPITVADQVLLMRAETDKLRVIAELDRQDTQTSRWVADLRGSFRYIAAGIIIVSTIVALFIPEVPKEFVEVMLQLTASVFSFMFGDRVYISLKRK